MLQYKKNKWSWIYAWFALSKILLFLLILILGIKWTVFCELHPVMCVSHYSSMRAQIPALLTSTHCLSICCSLVCYQEECHIHVSVGFRLALKHTWFNALTAFMQIKGVTHVVIMWHDRFNAVGACEVCVTASWRHAWSMWRMTLTTG